MNRHFRLLLVVGVFASLWGIYGCADEPVPETFVRPVKAMKIADREALSGRSFPGIAEANEEVNLAFDVAGEVIERPVNKGDKVKKGQLLARLDPQDFQNEINSARAEWKRASAYRDRIAVALKSNAVAQQELTDAQARLDQASANLKIKQKALDDAHILAPFDGVIAATFVERFQRVAAKQEVMRLLDLSKIKMTVDIPESLISISPYVKEVGVTFDAFPDREISARIKEIGTEASPTTRTFPVTVIMDQPEDIEILPGMAGRAKGKVIALESFNQSGYDIPVGAVFESEGKSFVWIIDETEKRVRKREIRLGELNDLGIHVTEGISPGEWIAVAGVHYLRENQQVRLMGNGGGEVSQ